MLVLDNASDDGSADAVRAGASGRAADRARAAGGQGRRTTRGCCARPRGRYCLLLNEDSELEPGCAQALVDALEADPAAAVAGRAAADERRRAHRLRVAPARRGLGAGRGRCSRHRPYAVQSRGARVRAVGWVQSSAMLVRREAAAGVGWLDPGFFVYSDETDFCRRLPRRRLADPLRARRPRRAP